MFGNVIWNVIQGLIGIAIGVGIIKFFAYVIGSVLFSNRKS
jgi:hypothetical protein